MLLGRNAPRADMRRYSKTRVASDRSRLLACLPRSLGAFARTRFLYSCAARSRNEASGSARALRPACCIAGIGSSRLCSELDLQAFALPRVDKGIFKLGNPGTDCLGETVAQVFERLLVMQEERCAYNLIP